MNTKRLPKQLLNLIEILDLPQFLLANARHEFKSSEQFGAWRIAQQTYQTWHWSSQQLADNLSLPLLKWRHRNGSADPVKNSWVKVRKPALRSGATCVVGFVSIVRAWKKPTIMKIFHVRNVRNTELFLKTMIPLQLHTPKFKMRTQTPKSRPLLVLAKTYSEQLNVHPNMSIATWTRVRLTQSSNL